MLKFAMNLTDDGMVGQQNFAGEATRLAYGTDEAKEGHNLFLEKRKPDFGDVGRVTYQVDISRYYVIMNKKTGPAIQNRYHKCHFTIL